MYSTVAPDLRMKNEHRMETAHRNLVPRPYFTGSENISDFQEKLEEYFLVDKIPNDDKLVILKCSLKANAKICFDTTGCTFLGLTLFYDTLVNKLKEASLAVRNKVELRQEFFTKRITFHDHPSDFSLRKLELHKLLELNMSLVAFMDTILPLITLPIQDHLDLKQLASYDTVFQLLKAFEQRHPRPSRPQYTGREFPTFRSNSSSPPPLVVIFSIKPIIEMIGVKLILGIFILIRIIKVNLMLDTLIQIEIIAVKIKVMLEILIEREIYIRVTLLKGQLN